MQLVIDISKGLYDCICDGHLNECLVATTNAIKNGTILGDHGALIDADELEYGLGAGDRDIYVKECISEVPAVLGPYCSFMNFSPDYEGEVK